MEQATSIIELRQYVQHWKDSDQSIAFVPTMGNLHDGHISLIEKGRSLCDRNICSIFVNPMQFGPNEDFNHYPRTLDRDIERLQKIGCDLLYLPHASDLYPEGLEKISQVQVTHLTDDYEGAHRPGHFAGVATVVLKLFNIVKPDVSIFGKKDYQQFRVISKMVDDFNLDVQIIGQETTRDPSGLATSSRNQYLDEEQTMLAANIYQNLQRVAAKISEGDDDFPALEQQALKDLQQAGFDCDYFKVCNPESLRSASQQDRDLVILVAATIGSTRLLDNIEISLW